MKIGLILAANIKLCPYVEIFKKVLDSNDINYDVISWDRESLGEDEGIVFHYSARNTRNILGKVIDYYKYASFVKKEVLKSKYDKLIVFGGAIGVFMYGFLKKYYSGRFWFDFRDLSIEQKFMSRFKKMCDISYCISISSQGFKKVFPAQYDFVISHNFDIDIVRSVIGQHSTFPMVDGPIIVSTIGQIRDYQANMQVVSALQNLDDFSLNFIGRGIASKALEYYVKKNKVQNVYFQGYYSKEEEADFYIQSNFINIFQSRVRKEMTLMSNRFYLALIHRKPLIVTDGSTQGEYVQKYKLGLSVVNCRDISYKIRRYIDSFNEDEFISSCDKLLIDFASDYDNFYTNLLMFVRNV